MRLLSCKVQRTARCGACVENFARGIQGYYGAGWVCVFIYALVLSDGWCTLWILGLLIIDYACRCRCVDEISFEHVTFLEPSGRLAKL